MNSKETVHGSEEKVPFAGAGPKKIHSHRELEVSAQKLKEALVKRETKAILSRANQFYRQISAHIREEDSPDGLYKEIEKTKPEIEHRLRHLRSQHERILNDLKTIMASDILYSFDMVSYLVRECLELVALHEKDEEKLITDVFYTDPVGGRG